MSTFMKGKTIEAAADSNLPILHNRGLTDAREGSSCHLGPFFSFLKFLLSLTELGQVEGSKLFSLLNLLLVGLDLSLELVGQLRHTVLVLVVFISLELKFLDVAFSLLEGLIGLRGLALNSSKFNLKLTNARLKLSHGIAATLGSKIIGFSKPLLKLSNLRFKSTLGLLLGAGVFLFSSQFISKAGSINHGSLGLLFRVLGLGEHVINLSMHGVNGTFKTALFSSSLGVNGGHVIDSTSGFTKLHVTSLLGTISRIKKGTRFLKLSLKGIGTAISQSSLFSKVTLLAAFLLIETFNIPQLLLVPLDALVSLRVSLVGMIKSNLKLIDVRLQLLLDAESLSLGTRLSLKRSLQRVHGTLMILTSVIELFLLLLDLPINLLTDLAKLKLSPQDLVLLLLKGSLSLLKSSL